MLVLCSVGDFSVPTTLTGLPYSAPRFAALASELVMNLPLAMTAGFYYALALKACFAFSSLAYLSSIFSNLLFASSSLR